ncbi:beta-lactamase/transpeptidase-like protein [Mycena alexandri]|uniref:Beta-lactamase/transpeptidase-like protein n=1 Tax=Mycena alexandri TaxID=1745969 RepID=A0AAD6X9F7_9AGAR|nr:beta-lactamase/transpeptidase-like protein [Mycena alexandri]
MLLLRLAPLLTAALGQSASQNPLQDLGHKVIDKKLSSYIQDQLNASNVTGASFAIIFPNGQVEFAAWGNRTEAGEPVKAETIFNLGSCSKAFLSASLGVLMQDFVDGNNKTALPDGVTDFNWDTKIRDLLPGEWMTEDEWTTEKASLKDLLSHVTGLPAHDGSYSSDASPRDIVARMRYLRAAYELRERFEYNNQMYFTGAYVVSKYSGSSYRDFVEERIFGPLGMKSSTLYPDRASETGKFTQSFTPSRRRIPFFMPEETAELIAGAGGVMSTVEDMTLWIKMLLNAGVDAPTNATIIPRTTFDLATSALSIAAKQGDESRSIIGYGLGWIRLSSYGHEVVLHNGGAAGVSTFVALYPHDGFGIVLLANTHDLPTIDLSLGVGARVLGLPNPGFASEDEMTPKPQTAAHVSQIQTAPLPNFVGTYSNAGYGNLTLCSPLFPNSRHCLDVIQDFRTVDSAAGKPTSSVDLYSVWPRFWGSHFRLSQVAENEYTATLSYLYVDGYGADRTAFEDYPTTMKVTFVVEESKVLGFGLFDVADQQSWRVKKGGSVEDTADVWFDRL